MIKFYNRQASYGTLKEIEPFFISSLILNVIFKNVTITNTYLRPNVLRAPVPNLKRPCVWLRDECFLLYMYRFIINYRRSRLSSSEVVSLQTNPPTLLKGSNFGILFSEVNGCYESVNTVCFQDTRIMMNLTDYFLKYLHCREQFSNGLHQVGRFIRHSSSSLLIPTVP